MRKRLLIGAIAAAVICVATFGLSRPREGTIDWYINEYADAAKEMAGRKWSNSFEAFYYKIVNKVRRSRRAPSQDLAIQFKRSEDARLALHKLGYLAKRRFILTNIPTTEAAGRVWQQRGAELSREEQMFVKFSYEGSVHEGNVLVIEGVAKHMDRWETSIRQADVPKTK